MDGEVTHYAILIGINNYAEYPLRGCWTDVESIQSHLQATLGNALRTQLLGSQDENDQPGLPSCDGLATWPSIDNLESAFKEVANQAKPGSFVYIHYSGHGTRRKGSGSHADTQAGNLALVLLAKGSNEPRYLPGSRLAVLLNEMVEKNLVVTLALDCCFSGSVYREGDDEPNEGRRFLPYDSAIAEKSFVEYFRGVDLPPSKQPVFRDASCDDNWLIKPDRYAIFTACGPNETTREVKVDGHPHGLLSYFLLDALKRLGCSASQREVYDDIIANTRSRAGQMLQQNPWRAGNPMQAFFGPPRERRSVGQASVPILRTKTGTIQLQAGQAHGVCDGDMFISSPTSQRQHSLVFKVSRTRGLTSDLEPLDDSTAATVSTGSYFYCMAYPTTRRCLQRFPIFLPSDLPGREEWVSALQERSLHITDTRNEPTSFEVEVLGDYQGYRILADSGTEVVRLPPADDTSIKNASDILEHFARYRLVETLVNGSPSQEFRSLYEVYVEAEGKKYRPGAELVLQDGTVVTLVIENRSTQPLHITVLDCGPMWQVEKLCRAPYITVIPQGTGYGEPPYTVKKPLRVRLKVPDEIRDQGGKDCVDVMKVIVTSRPSTSFALLELPRLGGVVHKTEKVERYGNEAEGKWEEAEEWDVVEFRIQARLGGLGPGESAACAMLARE